jgi:hypothetical protein
VGPERYDGRDESLPPEVASEPPGWLVAFAFIAAAAILSLGVCGLVLAVTATYRAPLAFALAALLFIGLIAFVGPRLPKADARSRSAAAVAAIGVVAIVGITVWNGANTSQHVLINRDGGAYANAGRWIARDGSLEVHPKVGAFRHDPQVHFADGGTATFANPTFHLQLQGAHFLPALLAEAQAVGGDRGMFLLPPILGGIALLEFFVLAWRLFRRPVFALAAMGALAFLLPEVSFARDTYTETVAQVLLFGALVLLVDRRVMPHWRRAFAAGLFLGAIQAARIDAPLLFFGLPIVMTVAWLRATTDDERRQLSASNKALVIGLVPGFLLGLADLFYRSRVYWDAQWNQERALFLATIAIAVACLVVVRLWPRLSRLLSSVPWDNVAWVSAGVVLIAGLSAWFIRPVAMPLHQPILVLLQRHGQGSVQYETAMYEDSMRWMSWYLGPLTLLAAIVGAACLTRSLVRGRRLYTLAAVALFVPESLLFLWNAHAYTDHVWVTRRFLTSTFPMLILLAVGLAAALWRLPKPSNWSTASRVGSVVIAIGAVAFPIWTILPVRSMHEQGGYLTTVEQACHVLGPNAAVVVLQDSTSASDTKAEWLPQTLRGWCGVPVGTVLVNADTHAEIESLASRWSQLHRKLFVVATDRAPIEKAVPEAQLMPVATTVNRRLLTQTFAHRPARYETQTFALAIGSLPAAGGQ